jgi:hypothetical protein
MSWEDARLIDSNNNYRLRYFTLTICNILVQALISWVCLTIDTFFTYVAIFLISLAEFNSSVPFIDLNGSSFIRAEIVSE